VSLGTTISRPIERKECGRPVLKRPTLWEAGGEANRLTTILDAQWRLIVAGIGSCDAMVIVVPSNSAARSIVHSAPMPASHPRAYRPIHASALNGLFHSDMFCRRCRE
jgi:hypothetical protein